MTSVWPLMPPGVAVIAIAVAALVGSPAPPERTPTYVDVQSSIQGCPSGHSQNVSVAVGTLRGADTKLGIQTVTQQGESHEESTASGADDTDEHDTQADAWRDVTPKDGSLVVKAEGARAQAGSHSPDGSADAVGFAKIQAGQSRGGGLMLGPCVGAHSQSWWVGPASSTKHFTSLELVNLADAPAVVDVSLWGRSGPVESVNGNGIVVKPNQRRLIKLSDLAAGESELAVRMDVRRGAVSASMLDSSTASHTGSEIIPVTSPPAQSTVISGVLRPESSTLLIANPGDHSARASVQELTEDGLVEPEGLDEIEVPAGSAVSVDLPDSAGTAAAAIRVRANHPVVAAARVQPTAKDYSYAVASDELTSPAIVPLSVGGALPSPHLVVTAASKTTVRIQTYDAEHRKLGQVRRSVPAHSTVAVDVRAEKALKAKNAAFARIDGKVRGAAVYRDSSSIAQIQLADALTRVLLPDIRVGRS